MKAGVIILTIISLALAGAGYFFYNQAQQTKDENEFLSNSEKELQFQIKSLEEEKEKVTKELAAKIADISKEKEEEIARVKGTFDKLVSDMKEEIEQGQIKITQMADRLSVTMVDKILFPSGEAGITPDGLKVMERVGNVLKNTEDKVIRIEGHTDNVPIHAKLKERFPTNWELSTARATNVLRFLQETTGMNPKRLEAVGMSEYHPVASNETAKGRSQNRRIEIALLPKLNQKK